MRTTLVLSDAAYEVARSLAHSQYRSLGEVVSELILQPKSSGEELLAPKKLGILTLFAPELSCVERVKELLDDESSTQQSI